MVRHEGGCTARPDRHCGMCDQAGICQPSLTELIALINEECAAKDEIDLYGDNVQDVLEKLEAAAEHCPACTLAAIRQADTKIYPNWKWEEKATTWWSEINAAKDPKSYY